MDLDHHIKAFKCNVKRLIWPQSNSCAQINGFVVGNHESVNMNQMYGFEGEVKSKYSSKMVDLYTEIFNWLPLCHCIENRILVSLHYINEDDNFVYISFDKILYIIFYLLRDNECVHDDMVVSLKLNFEHLNML